MTRLYLIYSLALLSLFSCDSKSEADENLIWSDEFNTEGAIDPEKWNYQIGNGCPEKCGFGNNELQYYTDSTTNIRIQKGALVIEAHQLTDSGKYTSAKITSRNKGDWKTGYIEVSAMLPEGRGTWPAIWMLPSTDKDLEWPADGEIDIMEHVGYNQGQIYGTIHTEDYNHIKGTQKSDSIFLDDASANFHVYAIHWTEDKIDWFVDDKLYHTVEKNGEGKSGWPFTTPFHLIINLAVGGNWGGKYGIDPNIWPQELKVDYVRVYKNKPLK